MCPQYLGRAGWRKRERRSKEKSGSVLVRCWINFTGTYLTSYYSKSSYTEEISHISLFRRAANRHRTTDPAAKALTQIIHRRNNEA